MKDVLYQFGRGADYEELLALSRPRHLNHCERNDFTLVTEGHAIAMRGYSWNSIQHLAYIEYLNKIADGVIVATVDADALIVQDTDIRTALGDNDLATHGVNFCSAAFTVVRNSQKVREFFGKVLLGPISRTIDAMANKLQAMLKENHGLKVQRLDDRWNYYTTYGAGRYSPNCAREDAIILGFHGGPLEYRKAKIKTAVSGMEVANG